jgi:hypothetical protein
MVFYPLRFDAACNQTFYSQDVISFILLLIESKIESKSLIVLKKQVRMLPKKQNFKITITWIHDVGHIFCDRSSAP